MKRSIKIIRNYIGKYLLKFLIYTKKFDTFPIFVKFFPKSTYKATHELLKRGYLNLAYETIKDYTPKEHEKHIKQRVLSMVEIRDNDICMLDNITLQKAKEINILFAVHNSLPYDKAGYAIRTHAIVTQLHKKNISLVVATRPGYPWDLQKYRNLPFKKQDYIDSVEYIHLEDTNRSFKKGADSDYINVYANELIKLAKERKSTIIHANSNYLNAHAAIQAANKLHIPSIYEIRGLWHLTRLTIDSSYRYNGMFEYEQKMVQTAAINATKVVVLSNAFKNLLVSWGIEEQKISVIPNAVDISLFEPQKPYNELIEKYKLQDRFVVGFIGSLTAYEGLEYLVRAVDELSLKYPISLVIVGDGKEKEKLQQITNNQNIIFTGRVPHNEVKKYYSIFDVCAYPRTDDEVCRYIPPLKPLEAMAMQKPIIVSALAPLLEMVIDGQIGIVCQSDDIKSLQESILRLYRDTKLRAEIALQARDWVSKHRQQKDIFLQYLKIYKEL